LYIFYFFRLRTALFVHKSAAKRDPLVLHQKRRLDTALALLENGDWRPRWPYSKTAIGDRAGLNQKRRLETALALIKNGERAPLQY
jgi:hypothetical protein